MFRLQLGYAKIYQCTCISLCITNSLKLAFQFGISAWSTSKRNPGRGFWVNFCKKCGDCDECGENKYFTAFHRISYKNSLPNLESGNNWSPRFSIPWKN